MAVGFPRPLASIAPGTREFESLPLVKPTGFREYDARWWFGHSGSDGVFLSYFCFYPEKDVFLYFVGNNGADPVRTTLIATLDTLQTSLGLGPIRPKPAPKTN